MVGGWATIFEFKDGGWLAIEQGKWVGAAHGKKKKKEESNGNNCIQIGGWTLTRKMSILNMNLSKRKKVVANLLDFLVW